jgi:hypothetical protein
MSHQIETHTYDERLGEVPNRKIYVARVVPYEVWREAQQCDDGGESQSIRAWFLARADELPPLLASSQALGAETKQGRTDGARSRVDEEGEGFIYVWERDGRWRPLPRSGPAGATEPLRGAGRHWWGYECWPTITSMARDAAGLDSMVDLMGNGWPTGLVDFLCRRDAATEWCLAAEDVLALWRGPRGRSEAAPGGSRG